MRFVQLIFWLQAFIGPVFLLGAIGALIGSEKMMFPLLIIGGVAGIILAEFIRRKIGLDVFFARIYGPNSMDKKENTSLNE